MVAAAKLHAPLAKWFSARFTAPSRIQKAALPHTLAGENTLILAPTGSGKTLAAFLSILSELGREAEAEGLPNAVRAVYVSPLKALDSDIRRNVRRSDFGGSVQRRCALLPLAPCRLNRGKGSCSEAIEDPPETALVRDFWGGRIR